MHVYFVRHGETISNQQNTVQGLDDPLAPQGELQAKLLADRLSHVPFETLITSDLVRARDTTRRIEDVTGKEAMLSDLFREVKRPTSMEGISRLSIEYEAFLTEERDNFGNASWRFEDAENYGDIKERAKAAIGFLEVLPPVDTVVVTHANFLRFITAYLLMQKAITPDIWRSLGYTLTIANTGITTFTYEDDVWKLITWNDRAHFAE